jgi:hypothetical protein
VTVDTIVTVVARPAAAALVFSLAVTAVIFILPIVLLIGGFITGWLVRAVLLPVRIFFASLSGSDHGTHVTQPIVAAIFFCFFTSRVSDQHRITAFVLSCALIVLLALIVFRLRASYRRHFPGVLFDQRFIAPVWDAISAQQRILTMLGTFAPLRPLHWAMRKLKDEIHHRRWQLFFGSLSVFSLYTLPIHLFPALNRWLIGAIDNYIETNNWHWLVYSPLFGRPIQMAAIGYLYVFDWCITILGVYAMIMLFSPLEARNTFSNVTEALRDFVRNGRIFTFTGFFWQCSACPSQPAVHARNKEQADSFKKIAELIHNETLNLDAALRGSFQGGSCRVALVYEPAGASEAKVRKGYCFHYWRLGRSSFLVAADARATRFDGSSAKSQAMFQQLAEGIGYLVNIRHSLK